MQWIAMVSMLIDHIGAYFLPEALWLRIVGRLAYPIYAYLIIRGMDRTRNRRQYIARLGIIALAAQAAYLLMGVEMANVVVTLMAGALAIWAAERWGGGAVWWAIAAILCEAMGAEYGLYGIALMAAYHYVRGPWMVAVHAAITVVSVGIGLISSLQIVSVLAAVLIVWMPLYRSRVPNWLWRSFYPAHLLVIALFTV